MPRDPSNLFASDGISYADECLASPSVVEIIRLEVELLGSALDVVFDTMRARGELRSQTCIVAENQDGGPAADDLYTPR